MTAAAIDRAAVIIAAARCRETCEHPPLGYRPCGTCLIRATPVVAALTDAGLLAAEPPDPESLDATRPVDLDLCPYCIDGAIQVQTGDPYPGAWDGVECWACAGTGIRGAA